MTDRSQTDIAARLLTSLGSLAHSVAIQAVATVAVTVALATVPWLPHASTPAAQDAASGVAATPAAAPQLPPLDPFTVSGIPPLGAFPMEAEAHFTTSLSRPFVALAGAEWRDDGPAALAQQAAPAGKRKKATAGCEDCEEPALLQQAAFVLPPPRPADLADGALLRRAPAVPAQAAANQPSATQPAVPAPAARLADIGWPSLPAMPSLPSLPNVGQLSSNITQARDVLGRSVSVATDSVTGIFKAF
ncbi:MAG: hypothetical protein U1E62_05825 [Alsobacter sp.]